MGPTDVVPIEIAVAAALENSLLYKTPIVRSTKQITIGYQPEIWKKWQ